MKFEAAEKEQFVQYMRLYEEFCGVQVLDYCVMTNHFHIVLEVPPRPKEGITEKELFRRLKLLYTEGEVEEIREDLRRAKKIGTEEAEEVKERYLCRMWDLSEYMKSLKQRFTQWFNGVHDREGTLWEGRFKSVIVEDGYALRVMSAYVDLNPVRAGVVEKPEDYRWCGYSDAVSGNRKARAGIERVMSSYEEFCQGRAVKRKWREVIANYRVILFTDGVERIEEDEVTGEKRVARKGVSKEESEKVKAAGGKLRGSAMLLQRIRHFTDGMAIGSGTFLEELFEGNRERFGPRRKSGARKIRGCETPLRALRDLQKPAK
jgi:REP element-mobilizing transposase RayT